MKNLENRIEKMLNGEKKRREIALKYIQKLETLMFENGSYIWGDKCIVDIENINNNKNEYEDTSFFLRYESNYQGSQRGFIVGDDLIEDLRGSDFWGALEDLLKWVKTLEKLIDEKETYRNSIVNMLPIEIKEGV